MPKFRSVNDLEQWRSQLQADTRTRSSSRTTIVVGMGTCGISAGARAVHDSIVEEVQSRNMDVDVVAVGCIGMCAKEPLVDIRQGSEPRVTYGNVTPKMVPDIIQRHVVQGEVIDNWVIGRVEPEQEL